MLGRDRFSKKLICPQCGNSGIADVSEIDDTRRKTPGFAVDVMPPGFATEKTSNYPQTYIVKCGCGRKFPFETVVAAPV